MSRVCQHTAMGEANMGIAKILVIEDEENIQELLVSKKAQSETITDFMALMNSCEFARYAPSTSVAMQQDYDKAVHVISELSKQI